MMRKELGLMKLTAQFEARYGLNFSNALWERVCNETEFQFLYRSRDRREKISKKNWFFSGLVNSYSDVIKTLKNYPVDAVLEVFFAAVDGLKKKQEEEEVVEKVETDRFDFVVSDEYFVDIESREWPPLGSRPVPRFVPYMYRVGIPKGDLMRKEFGVIKLTAQFVRRYGNDFWDVLWEKLCDEAQFQFLKRNPGNDDRFFSQLLVVYGDVINPWDNRPRKSDTARMDVVVEGFFVALDAFKKKQEEEEDEVVEKVVTDRSDFVVNDEYFVDIEFTLPEN